MGVYYSEDSACLCKGGRIIGHLTGRVRAIIMTGDGLHVIVRMCVKEQRVCVYVCTQVGAVQASNVLL